MLPGVSFATKKNGTCYYRSAITYYGKHISLGSYATELEANKAYLFAQNIVANPCNLTTDNYQKNCVLSYHKWIVLHNFKDNQIYCKNPIYLKNKYFEYHLSPQSILKFDVDDLFYFAHHKILKRGGYLFVSDYGMQVNLLSRYGIKNYAVLNRDYIHINGDTSDYRYSNVLIINRYHGVTSITRKGLPFYIAKIHIHGDYIIGKYKTEHEAAIAYNKAVLLLQQSGMNKNFHQNYLEDVNAIQYASIYQKVRISNRLLSYVKSLRDNANGSYNK